VANDHLNCLEVEVGVTLVGALAPSAHYTHTWFDIGTHGSGEHRKLHPLLLSTTPKSQLLVEKKNVWSSIAEKSAEKEIRSSS
jgi:hypothetical protein